jgi:poly(A) polymerase
MENLTAVGISEQEAVQQASDTVIEAQLKHTALPRRFSLPMREIWALQSRFAVRTGKRPLRLMLHPRFRAAYDFLLLRAETDTKVTELAEWWTHFLSLDEVAQEKAIRIAAKPKIQRRHRTRANRDKSASAPTC